MTPVKFDQCNVRYGPPEGLAESQVRTIDAFRSEVQTGSMEGSQMTVVAYRPTQQEVEQLQEGGLIYITFMGGLPPHFPSTSFVQATNPA